MSNEVVIENVKENYFEYRGWKVEHNIDYSTCECCGTSTTLLWDAHRHVNGNYEAIYEATSLEDLFSKIDAEMER